MSHFGTKIRSSHDAISLRVIVKDAENYTFQKARCDISAAVSIALLSIPQALAYSLVVGIPPMAGLISMILGTSIAAMLASSSHLVMGPNNATSLLIQAGVTEVLQKFYPEIVGSSREAITIDLIMTVTLLIGITQLTASIFTLGRLIQFVSHAVVVGYITGSAVAIAIGQLFPLTGISCPGALESLYQKIMYLLFHIHSMDGLTLGIGIASLLLLIGMRHFQWKIPESLAMLFVMTSIVFCLPSAMVVDSQGQGIQLMGCGDISSLSCSVKGPIIEFRLLNSLLPLAFAVALIGMLEANSISKALAASTGDRLVGNQEVFALGCSNFLLSFFGGLPCSGSAARSKLNVESGAKTRFAAFYSGIVVGLLVLSFGSFITYVPRASLAALLIATAMKLIDIKQIALCWRATKSDALVLMVTFLSCIFFSLSLAFYMGIAFSIILYLRKAAIPRVAEYIYQESTGELHQATEVDKKVPHAIRMINVEGELFFGAVDLFQNTLRAIAEDDLTTKVILLRLKHVHDLDATTALALRQLKDFLHQSGQYLIVCEVPSHVIELLENVHLVDYIGRDNVIVFDETTPKSWLDRALSRARVLLQQQEACLHKETSVSIQVADGTLAQSYTHSN